MASFEKCQSKKIYIFFQSQAYEMFLNFWVERLSNEPLNIHQFRINEVIAMINS